MGPDYIPIDYQGELFSAIVAVVVAGLILTLLWRVVR